MNQDRVTVIGGGLAGCEAAWQVAEAGIPVKLVEMKPLRRTAAQSTDSLGELVCSNSLRSADIKNAVGLLKEEARKLGSLILQVADKVRVPAGGALAVDRVRFAESITRAIDEHALIERQTEILCALPEPSAGPVIVATGPLTGEELAADIIKTTGGQGLYFYDAIAPIISADSVDRTVAFAASRYGKGEGNDYLNCPMNQDQYERFIDALLEADCMPLHSFEEPRFFQGCLPIEVVAAGGRETLRFGTMKPVGLSDPRDGRRPYAVVQLRKEDREGQALNLVGFQTKLKHPDQRRLFRTIPALEAAEFLRLGGVHRNTYLDAPSLLDSRMRLRARPNIRFAGQITGVEGYVESAAHGLLTGMLLAADLEERALDPPPRETALGALWAHLLGEHRLPNRSYEPQNIHWGLFPTPPPGTRKKEKKEVRVNRATLLFEQWARSSSVRLRTPSCAPKTAR